MIARKTSIATESPSQVLRRLEVTLIWMWSTEPGCPVGERSAVLARLNAVSARIERLGLRHDVDPDDYIDVAELIVCKSELDDLGRRWLDPSDVTTQKPMTAPSRAREQVGASL